MNEKFVPMELDGFVVRDGQPVAGLVVVASFDRIICPACGHVQGASTHRGVLGWPIYVHECEACCYVITESEWISADELEASQCSQRSSE